MANLLLTLGKVVGASQQVKRASVGPACYAPPHWLEGVPELRLKPNGDCIFWEDGCTVYPGPMRSPR